MRFPSHDPHGHYDGCIIANILGKCTDGRRTVRNSNNGPHTALSADRWVAGFELHANGEPHTHLLFELNKTVDKRAYMAKIRDATISTLREMEIHTLDCQNGQNRDRGSDNPGIIDLEADPEEETSEEDAVLQTCTCKLEINIQFNSRS